MAKKLEMSVFFLQLSPNLLSIGLVLDVYEPLRPKTLTPKTPKLSPIHFWYH